MINVNDHTQDLALGFESRLSIGSDGFPSRHFCMVDIHGWMDYFANAFFDSDAATRKKKYYPPAKTGLQLENPP